MSPAADDGPRALILASASPRRSHLLGSAGVGFEVIPSDVPEDRLNGEPPTEYVRRLAASKAGSVASRCRARGDRRAVLGADTVVVLGDEVIGKPASRAEARHMLGRLSGRTHRVITGFCVLLPDGAERHQQVETKVTFKRLAPAELEHYLDSGEWEDKAGAYAIQGGAAYMVSRIEGSYTNVVGLPLCEVVEVLRSGPVGGQGGGEP